MSFLGGQNMPDNQSETTVQPSPVRTPLFALTEWETAFLLDLLGEPADMARSTRKLYRKLKEHHKAMRDV